LRRSAPRTLIMPDEVKYQLNLQTPLGEDALMLRSFEGTEQLSNPFSFFLEMRSKEPELDSTKIVGKAVTFSCRLSQDHERFFHGHVQSFTAFGTDSDRGRSYLASVVPQFSLLLYHADCRIFQEMTVPEIIEQVFKDRGLSAYELKLRGTYPKLEFCVQYGETDYHFVSRLLEEIGAYYYFIHEKSKHTMVLADDATGYVDCKESKVAFAGQFDSQLPGQLTWWDHRIEFTSGKFVQTDFNFEQSTTKLETSEKTVVKLKGPEAYEVFEYPGGYLKVPDGKTLATARMQQLEVRSEMVNGSSTCGSFHPGGKFTVSEHPDAAQKGKAFVLYTIAHGAKEPSLYPPEELSFASRAPAGQFPEYSNSFSALPAKVVFRPERTTPWPYIRGPQTAIVVGPKGSEIYTDKFGRVKVQFHWDRKGKLDEKSSCWIRVAQSWSGKNWGTLFTPRVGSEVMVEFLEGDPSRPIITGSVYNDQTMPPWKLPDEMKFSGVKTHSVDKADAKSFNELRFDDTKDKEQIYFHAQRDFVRVVENDDTLKVGFDKKDKGAQTIDIYHNRQVTIEKGDDKLHLKTGKSEFILDKGDHLVSIKMGKQATVLDKGDQLVTLKMGSQKVKLGAGEHVTEAMQAITFKVGSSQVKIDQQGITIKGLMVKIEGSVSAEIKGSVATKVGGGAMTEVKGAIVKIN
jgi:type VI secretion system secreted protein VgrG